MESEKVENFPIYLVMQYHKTSFDLSNKRDCLKSIQRLTGRLNQNYWPSKNRKTD